MLDEEMMEAFGLDGEDNAEEVKETTINTEDETMGNVKISVDVVARIASIAASEIEGVSSMYQSFVDGVAQKLGKKNASQGVKVEIVDEIANIDLYLVVEYGVKIPELAWNVQESVKANVESMTGLNVAAVNIHIEGIDFSNDIDLPEE